VRMLREAGAVEVHVRISAPPVRWPCFYGIDFPTRAELIANGMAIDELRRSIGADTLGYVSLDGLVTATEQPKTRLCRACFDGEYPIELPAGHLIGKHILEGVDRRVGGTGVGGPGVTGGNLGGGGDDSQPASTPSTRTRLVTRTRGEP
jgi:amidophosphoribosyltransferase